jgi:hypothetical protein
MTNYEKLNVRIKMCHVNGSCYAIYQSRETMTEELIGKTSSTEIPLQIGSKIKLGLNRKEYIVKEIKVNLESELIDFHKPNSNKLTLVDRCSPDRSTFNCTVMVIFDDI